jgi:hypothetical protein
MNELIGRVFSFEKQVFPNQSDSTPSWPPTGRAPRR